jgi:hypothetical protein
MTLRRAVAATESIVATTLSTEGALHVATPVRSSLMCQRRSRAGNGSCRSIATLQREDLVTWRAAMYRQADAHSDASAQAAGRSTGGGIPVGQASPTPPASAFPSPSWTDDSRRNKKQCFVEGP